MKKEFRLPGKVETFADHLFNHRLQLAEREFSDLATQLEGLDPTNLPDEIALTINGFDWQSVRKTPGPEIFKFPDEDHHAVINFLPLHLLENRNFYLLLLPELNEISEVVGLSLGFAKHDGKQYFTGWLDSSTQLSAQRQKPTKKLPYLLIVQRTNANDLSKQIEANKIYGVAYRFNA